jgi:hypothetical protein
MSSGLNDGREDIALLSSCASNWRLAQAAGNLADSEYLELSELEMTLVPSPFNSEVS